MGFEPKIHSGIWVGKSEKTAEHLLLSSGEEKQHQHKQKKYHCFFQHFFKKRVILYFCRCASDGTGLTCVQLAAFVLGNALFADVWPVVFLRRRQEQLSCFMIPSPHAAWARQDGDGCSSWGEW